MHATCVYLSGPRPAVLATDMLCALDCDRDCSEYTCFCGTWGTQGCPDGKCMPSSFYNQDQCPATHGCAEANMCDAPVSAARPLS